MKTPFLAFTVACVALTTNALAAGPDEDGDFPAQSREDPAVVVLSASVIPPAPSEAAQPSDAVDPHIVPYLNEEMSGE